MSRSATLIALSAITQPDPQPGVAPEWLRLFPKGKQAAADGRGPWFYENATALTEASFAAPGRIHVDVDHGTMPGAKGGDTRAYGYIGEMEEREDGLWGRVEWTAAGQALMEDRAYWGVSPVFLNAKDGRITRIVSVAITNRPALRQLTALTFTDEGEDGMDFRAMVAEMVGLTADASDEDIAAALKKKMGADAAETTEALTALSEVRDALGVEDGATRTELVATVKALRAGAGEAGEQLAALSAQVKAMQDGDKKRTAEAFVDKAIADKRAGVKPAREHYVALHMENPARAEAMVAGLPQLGESALSALPPGGGEQLTALSADQRQVADMLGLEPETYLAQLKADAKAKETV
ncbi:phage protease [Citreimonas salinaria]|uniref:Mu-like prophage I protein n=1 Tax=Citreimonas salinaria TaxID=321339 RepID=A0A1H3KT62_9RHOB|nr:phage protease [Citreimonas salinaria]SDY55301.1 Mu-like prophage I protein [Citreimonas salinaria]